MTSEKYYIGIDIGSVSINCILINNKKDIIYECPYIRHTGKIEEKTTEIIKNIYNEFNPNKIESIAFTGNYGEKISEKINSFYEIDTICQVIGACHICPDVKTIMSMGGQDAAFFQISHFNKEWEIDHFAVNGPCASGTGSFIDQQAQRLSGSLYDNKTDMSSIDFAQVLMDFIKLGAESETPANVACRCTVFTKSDMIHLQNKGESLKNIIYGLHIGNARNYISSIIGNREVLHPIILIGGLSYNSLQIKALEQIFNKIIIPPYSTSIGAIGAALYSLEAENKKPFDIKNISLLNKKTNLSIATTGKLELKYTEFPENNDEKIELKEKTDVYIGIDIGSTTTKYAIIDKQKRIIRKNYVQTLGRPIEVTQKLLKDIADNLKRQINIAGIAATGSGRNVVGDFLNADLIIDEITAHAKGAVQIDPNIDTIFEIGGQDSKYISIANSSPLDFDMNKVCAAGTGSFLQELGNKYGINIVNQFQKIAMESDKPVKLAERCTVFMESDLVYYHQKSAPIQDLIAGLCYAVVHNYLNRVVGKRKIGKKVMFLGGPSLNKGVVAAFEKIIKQKILLPKHREVLGAYGAAISVFEKMSTQKKSAFRGLESAIKDKMKHTEKTCKADQQCHNKCKLKIYNFDGRISIWGGECGRYERSITNKAQTENLFFVWEKIWLKYMRGFYEELKDKPIINVKKRPTIGMQRTLYTLQTAILWARFFDKLGYHLVLTPPTNTKISKLGISAASFESCYPIKNSFGHLKLLANNTKYIFIPSMIDMPVSKETNGGLYCPMVQSNSYMAKTIIKTDNPASILEPVVHLKYSPDILARELYKQIGNRLNKSKSDIKKALYHATEIQNNFIRELHQIGENYIKSQNKNKPIVIVTGRPYNLYDEALNLKIGKNLNRIGINAIPMDFIDTSQSNNSDFSFMYWGLGAKILKTAEYIKNNQNLFGIHLTNFSCGPDSFIEHFYKNIMENKPYLILELDEHSATAGIITRLEAYKNIIDKQKQN